MGRVYFSLGAEKRERKSHGSHNHIKAEKQSNQAKQQEKISWNFWTNLFVGIMHGIQLYEMNPVRP